MSVLRVLRVLLALKVFRGVPVLRVLKVFKAPREILAL